MESGFSMQTPQGLSSKWTMLSFCLYKLQLGIIFYIFHNHYMQVKAVTFVR